VKNLHIEPHKWRDENCKEKDDVASAPRRCLLDPFSVVEDSIGDDRRSEQFA